MSYFNEEQQEHMRSIRALPDEKVSWCGWGTVEDAKRGHCCSPSDCPGKTEGKTLADKKKVWCPSCRNVPNPDGKLIHSKWCGEERRP